MRLQDVASALFSIWRPASAAEISEVCRRLGNPVDIEEIEAVCATPNSPFCAVANNLITFSPKALDFFSETLCVFQRQVFSLSCPQPETAGHSGKEQPGKLCRSNPQRLELNGKVSRVSLCPMEENASALVPFAGGSLDCTATEATPLQYVEMDGTEQPYCGGDIREQSQFAKTRSREIASAGLNAYMKKVDIPSKKKKKRLPIPDFHNYKIVGEEGSGGFSVVYTARRLEDDRLFAIKCPYEGVSENQFDKEIKLLKTLGGRHSIIRMEEVIVDSQNKYIVLDHIEHDKPEVLKKDITVLDLRWYGFFLFKALNYLHQKKIAHRDVKPGNFLYSRNKRMGYLVDFNLALEITASPKNSRSNNSKENKGEILSPAEMSFAQERKVLIERRNVSWLNTIIKQSGPYEFKQQGAVGSTEPLPKNGRKELIEYVAKNVPTSSVLSTKRKRVNSLKPLECLPGPRALPEAPPKRRRRQLQEACVGTKGYSAPEVLLKSRQTVKIDVWSAGVTLLQLATGKLPFSSGALHQTLKAIARLRGTEDLKKMAEANRREELTKDLESSNSIPVMEWAKTSTDLPPSFYDLIERCLQVDPSKRLNAREAMQHEFFSPCLRARRCSEQTVDSTNQVLRLESC